MNEIQKLASQMIQYYCGDPDRIQHFIKVHSFAKLIGESEKVSTDILYVLEVAALVHDIGIKPSEEKYGRCDGNLQEKEGVEPTRRMLTSLDFPPDIIDRVIYLVAHHHTYSNVDGIDYRILLEADFLVNLYENKLSEEAVKAALTNIFRTKTGTEICKTMYGIKM